MAAPPSASQRIVTVKWSGKEFQIGVEETSTVGDLKRRIEEHTNVRPVRQKLLGLKTTAKGAPNEETAVSELALKPGQKILLVGCVRVELQLARASR